MSLLSVWSIGPVYTVQSSEQVTRSTQSTGSSSFYVRPQLLADMVIIYTVHVLKGAIMHAKKRQGARSCVEEVTWLFEFVR